MFKVDLHNPGLPGAASLASAVWGTECSTNLDLSVKTRRVRGV